MAQYRNTTKSSVYAGGQYVPQRGYVEITEPISSEQALITSGSLKMKKTAENLKQAKPKSKPANEETS